MLQALTIRATTGWRTTSSLWKKKLISVHLSQHFDGVAQARFAARQVNLGDVTGDNRFRVEADTRQEHLHLFDGGVLALIQNNERIVKGTATHVVLKRGDFNHVTLNKLSTFSKPNISNSRTGGADMIHLLTQVPGRKPSFSPASNSRAGQQNTADLLALQRINRSGDGQIGFYCTRRTYAEGDVAVENVGKCTAPEPGTRLNDATFVFDI